MQQRRRWLFVAASSLLSAGLLWTQTGAGQGAAPQSQLGKIAGPGLPPGRRPVHVLRPLPVLSLPHLTVVATLVPGPAAFGRGLRIVGQHFGARADRKVRIARADGTAVYFPRIDRWSDTEIVVTLASGHAARLGFAGSFSGDNPPHASCQVTITTAAGVPFANQLALEVFAAAPLGAHDAARDGETHP